MSLLAMDTSSLFDPFEFPSEIDMEPPKPQPKFREKLEIKSSRHHDHHLKVCCTAPFDWELEDVVRGVPLLPLSLGYRASFFHISGTSFRITQENLHMTIVVVKNVSYQYHV